MNGVEVFFLIGQMLWVVALWALYDQWRFNKRLLGILDSHSYINELQAEINAAHEASISSILARLNR